MARREPVARRIGRIRRSVLTFGAASAMAVAATLTAEAQDTSHPASIHAGTCPAPGNAVVSLWDVSRDFLVDGDAAAGESVGTPFGYPTEASITTVEIELASLVATEHAILLHRSPAEMDDYLVCGDIGGSMLGTDRLPVALASVGSSAWSGIAILDDEGDGTTTVSIFAFEGPGIDTGAGEAPVTPGPTRSASPDDDVQDADDDDEGEDDDHQGDDDHDDDDHDGGHDGRSGGDEGEGTATRIRSRTIGRWSDA